MDQYNWTTIARDQLTPKTSRQAIHTSRMTIAKLEMKKGSVVPLHHHENEQVTMVESGILRFIFPGDEDFILGAGDVLQIPSHVPHSVEVIEDAIVTDLFTPQREDWLRGDDAYLRQQGS